MSPIAVTPCISLNKPATFVYALCMGWFCSYVCYCTVFWTVSSTSVSTVNLLLMGFLYTLAGVSLNQMRLRVRFAVLNGACAYGSFSCILIHTQRMVFILKSSAFVRITRAIVINIDHIWQPLVKWNLFVLSYSWSKQQHKPHLEAFIQLKNAASELIAS